MLINFDILIILNIYFMRKRTIIIISFVIILLIAAFIFLPKLFNKQDNNVTSENKPSRTFINVSGKVISSKPLEYKIVSTGSIISNEEVELHSEITGKIIIISFKEGARVKKGDLLVKINDNDLQAQLKKAELKKQLAEQNEYRQKTLLGKNGISQETYDNALNELMLIKADIEYIKTQIEKTEIRAPFDGIVGLRYVSDGSFISPATKIATVQNLNPIKIDFSIPQAYSNYINIGNKIDFRLSGKAQSYTASIYAVEPKIDINSRTLQVRALCPNNGDLMPGSYIEVEINLSNINNTILIPSDALIPDIQGELVYLFKDGKAIPKVVVSAIRTEKEVQITQGLNIGDTIITSGIIQLKPGLPVILNKVE